MLLFIAMSVIIFILLTLASEWLMDMLFSSNNRLTPPAGRPKSRVEMRAETKAEFEGICDDMVWQQMVTAKRWPVSAKLFQRAFRLSSHRFM